MTSKKWKKPCFTSEPKGAPICKDCGWALHEHISKPFADDVTDVTFPPVRPIKR